MGLARQCPEPPSQAPRPPRIAGDRGAIATAGRGSRQGGSVPRRRLRLAHLAWQQVNLAFPVSSGPRTADQLGVGACSPGSVPLLFPHSDQRPYTSPYLSRASRVHGASPVWDTTDSKQSKHNFHSHISGRQLQDIQEVRTWLVLCWGTARERRPVRVYPGSRVL